LSSFYPATALFLDALQRNAEIVGIYLVGSKSREYDDERSDGDIGKRRKILRHEPEEGKILSRDPRIGKRALYLMKLPTETFYGTVKSVVRFSYGDALLVHFRPGMQVNAEVENFALLDKHTPEWYPQDRVRRDLDNGGFLFGTVLHPTFFNGNIGILVQFDDGHKLTLPPGALKKA
jgi:hypothetical protein